MEDGQLIVPLLRSSLDKWAALLSKSPEGIALAAISLPVVLAMFSRRLIVVLGCIILAIIAFCALVAPSNVAVTLATGIYLGSLLIVLLGTATRRTARVRRVEFASLQKEVNRLRQDVNGLSHAEQRRFMKELTSTSEHSVSIVPASGDLGARGNGSSADSNRATKKATRRRKVARSGGPDPLV
jgi:hypothetical protein